VETPVVQPDYVIEVVIEDVVVAHFAFFKEDEKTLACVVGVHNSADRQVYAGLLQGAQETLSAARFRSVSAEDSFNALEEQPREVRTDEASARNLAWWLGLVDDPTPSPETP